MEAACDASMARDRGQTLHVCLDLGEVALEVGVLIAVVSELEEGDAELGGGVESRARRRVPAGQQPGRDHRQRDPFGRQRCMGSRQVALHVLRQYVAPRTGRQVGAREAQRAQCRGQFLVAEMGQVLGEQAKCRLGRGRGAGCRRARGGGREQFAAGQSRHCHSLPVRPLGRVIGRGTGLSSPRRRRAVRPEHSDRAVADTRPPFDKRGLVELDHAQEVLLHRADRGHFLRSRCLLDSNRRAGSDRSHAPPLAVRYRVPRSGRSAC